MLQKIKFESKEKAQEYMKQNKNTIIEENIKKLKNIIYINIKYIL